MRKLLLFLNRDPCGKWPLKGYIYVCIVITVSALTLKSSSTLCIGLAACWCVRQIGSEGLQSHVRHQLSVHLQSVFRRLETIESGLLSRSSDEPHRRSATTWLDQLEQRLSELESTFASGRRDQHRVAAEAAAAAAGSARAMHTDELENEFQVYERVLQVLTNETTRIQQQMTKSAETQQQWKSTQDSLQQKVRTGTRRRHCSRKHCNKAKNVKVTIFGFWKNV